MSEAALVRDRASTRAWIRPRRILRVTAFEGSIESDSRLLCGAGKYHLDVVVREGPDPGHVELVGHVTDLDRPERPVTGLPVALLRGGGSGVARLTRTDDAGDFEIGGIPTGRCGLRLGGREDDPCVVVWERAG